MEVWSLVFFIYSIDRGSVFSILASRNQKHSLILLSLLDDFQLGLEQSKVGFESWSHMQLSIYKLRAISSACRMRLISQSSSNIVL